MTKQNSLEPSEQKTIIFYDDELTAVKLPDGEIWVPVRRLCDNLGLTWSSQYMRIQRDEVLSEAAKTVLVTRTVKPGERGGGAVETVCLPLDLVPGWLFGVQPSRVREEIRPKLARYRRECFRVLWDAFKQDVLPTLPAAEMTPAEQALAQVEALYNLARQQVALERWLVHHDARLDTVEEMAELVKAIAHTLTEQNPAGGNYYQSVWSELHRRYGVTTYRRVPADHFADVIAWLEGWLESLRQGGQDT
jgi:hypothetical protein